MADQVGSGKLKDNITTRKTWVRLLYMVIIAIAWNIAEILFWAVTVLQFLLKLFTGDTNDYLTRFGRQLSAYFAQAARFETFNTEDIPFPFSPWPDGDESDKAEAAVPAPASTKTTKPRATGTRRSSGSRARKKPDDASSSTDTPDDEAGAKPTTDDN